MNSKELQAARKLLMLEASEAAEFIGNVSVRSWQYWETGQRTIPADVIDRIGDLLRMRRDMIGAIDSAAPSGQLQLRYFSSLGEFRSAHADGTVLGWRLHQSAVAHFVGGGRAELA
ncbi:MAG TPA: DUF1870 domain-containing protein [Stenotrophomonas sp.]|nr:DUF1870 domain-containing protein [Stenotrophomonas sp.]